MIVMNEDTFPLSPGSLLNSGTASYRIVKVLGRGGFGITYLAETEIKFGNITHSVKVAIKEAFPSDLCWREPAGSAVLCSQSSTVRVDNAKKDFIAEALRLQSLGSSHENIVKVNEVFEANNTAYYVMEYLNGENLRKYVGRTGAGWSVQILDQIIIPVARALKCLHNNRMTHLDVKPDNIMIVTDDTGILHPVMIDFGLSKHYDQDGLPTSTINTLGLSPGYSPIEQYGGIRQFSPQSDVYALAATILFCFTGHDPKEATRIKKEEIIGMIPPQAGLCFQDTMLKCLAPFSDERISDISYLLQTLSAVCQQWNLKEVDCFDLVPDEVDTPNLPSVQDSRRLSSSSVADNRRDSIHIQDNDNKAEVIQLDNFTPVDSKKRWKKIGIVTGSIVLIWLTFYSYGSFFSIKSTTFALGNGKVVRILEKGKPNIFTFPKYGLEDHYQNRLLEFEYDYVSRLKTPLFLVKKEGKYGVYDARSEKMIVPIEYSYIRMFDSSGGDDIIETVDTYSSPRVSDIIYLDKNSRVGLCDVTGKIILPVEYDCVTDGKDRLIVKKNGKEALSDWDFRQLTQLEYDDIAPIKDAPERSSAYAIVQKNGYYSVMDKNGRILTPKSYERIEIMDNPPVLFKVGSGKVWGMVDWDGNEITDVAYSEIVMPTDGSLYNKDKYEDHLVKVKSNGLWGYINLRQYDFARPSRKLRPSIPCIYEEASFFERTKMSGTTYICATVKEKKSSNRMLIDDDGRQIGTFFE